MRRENFYGLVIAVFTRKSKLVRNEMDNWQKVEVISKVVAALLVPMAIAYMGNGLSVYNKQRDVEAKFVELATVILNRDPSVNNSGESRVLRKWAVDVINKFSGVEMSPQVETILIERQALPSLSFPQGRSDTLELDSTWGVVFGGDSTLNSAKHEVTVTARSMGIADAVVFRRSGSFRSVRVYPNRMEADAALVRAKSIRDSSYLVNMAKWCPTSVAREGYFECGVP